VVLLTSAMLNRGDGHHSPAAVIAVLQQANDPHSGVAWPPTTRLNDRLAADDAGP
jgi:hypothetical protein